MAYAFVTGAIIRMDEDPAVDIHRPGRAGEDLFERAKSGDLTAFEQLVICHERHVFRLALRLTGTVEDAKDATQETLWRLHRKIGQIHSAASLGAWLYSVTANVCREMGRSRRRSRLVFMNEAVTHAVADPAPSPERLLAAKQREDHLQSALAILPEKERAALLLREMEGLSTREVAAILGSSESTVRVQISSARLKLREFLAKCAKEES